MRKKKITGKDLINKLTEGDEYLTNFIDDSDIGIYEYHMDGKAYRIYTDLDDFPCPNNELRKIATSVHDLYCNEIYGLDDEVKTLGKQCSRKRR